MGMARQNQLIEPELVIFGDALRHLLMAADEGGPGSGPDQTDAGPQIRAHLEVAAVPTVQREHPLLPDRFALREQLLSSRHQSRIHGSQKSIGLPPCLALSVAGDYVEADSETELSAFGLGLRPYAFDALAHHFGRLTP